VPRSKAIAFEKTIHIGTDMHTAADVRFLEKKKVYYCISCAKHLKIFEKKKHAAEMARRF